jgi:hypothetical protein
MKKKPKYKHNCSTTVDDADWNNSSSCLATVRQIVTTTVLYKQNFLMEMTPSSIADDYILIIDQE